METLKEKPERLVSLYDEDARVWKLLSKDREPLKSLKIIEDALLKFSLSRNEIRVYIYLARSGIRKAREISDALSLHRTETYKILRDLEKRGLVSSVLEKPYAVMKSNIKVVILCGGKGTRLHEETELRPKPMVEIGGKPILWHIMKIYAHYGFNEFILCLGYKGDVIRDYFRSYDLMHGDFIIELGKNEGVRVLNRHDEREWKITLAETGDEAMTGARVKRVEEYVDGDTFMLTYGDGVADINIKKLLELHRSHGKIGTVTAVHPLPRFGRLELKGDKVVKFTKQGLVKKGYIDGGFFVFNKDFFDYLRADDYCVLEEEPLENLARDRELFGYKHEGFWYCIDTYRDYLTLNNMWNSNRAPWKIWEK